MMQGAYAEAGLTVSAAFSAVQGEGDELAGVTTRLMVANVLRDMLRAGELESRKAVPLSSSHTPFSAVHYWIKGAMPVDVGQELRRIAKHSNGTAAGHE
jgi:hypothetical protein